MWRNLEGVMKYVWGWEADGGSGLRLAAGCGLWVLLSDGEVCSDMKRSAGPSKNGEMHCHATGFFAAPSGQLLEAIAKVTDGSYF